MKLKKLYPSFSPIRYWRMEKKSDEKWRRLRERILERDDYTCRYCGFRAKKWQTIHHIDRNPDNNDENNLETVCPMCNLILHVGYGCEVLKIVDLYKESKYSQNEIIQITRMMRAEGKSDEEIIEYLGLKHKVRFIEDNEYLRHLFGFITSRKPPKKYENIERALEYGYEQVRKKYLIKPLNEFM